MKIADFLADYRIRMNRQDEAERSAKRAERVTLWLVLLVGMLALVGVVR